MNLILGLFNYANSTDHVASNGRGDLWILKDL
jgi:hypothetical protein